MKLMIILNFCYSLIFGWFILTQLHVIETNILADVLDDVEGSAADIINYITTGSYELSSECNMNTSERIAYYNYTPEVHTVTTARGDVITLVRVNSNVSCASKRTVFFLHGLYGSSDDITVNRPGQGLAYILADNCYDVWLTNNRGNCYSRTNSKLNPNTTLGAYWNFSWDDIARQDYKVIFNYIQTTTNRPKSFCIAHSQGTSSIMAFLSVFPEWNQYFYAASLMAPVAYVTHSRDYFVLGKALSASSSREGGVEILPRTSLFKLVGALCKGLVAEACLTYLRVLMGADSNQNINKTMIPIYFCAFPSGSAVNQINHYVAESTFDYYGPQMNVLSGVVPGDFPVGLITVPLSLHYSNTDPYTVEVDVNRLISKLTGTTDLYVQKLDNFNHLDYIYSTQAYDLVYSNILSFFDKHYTP